MSAFFTSSFKQKWQSPIEKQIFSKNKKGETLFYGDFSNQNDTYKIAMNGYKARKVSKMQS